MGVEFVSKSEFNSNPELQKQYGSYEKFMTAYTEQLKSTSIMKLSEKVFNALPQTVKDNIWAQSKKADAEKVAAEEAYYAARKAEADASYAQSLAETEFKKLQQSSLDKNSLKYKEGYAKYMSALNNSASASFTRELLGEKMVNASKLSLSAFSSALIADNSLNIKG